MTVVCQEQGFADVPMEQIIGSGAFLESVLGEKIKSFFDVAIVDGRLRLKARDHVGLFPITESLSIEVRPRVPVANLIYMASKAQTNLACLPDFIRRYGFRTSGGTIPAPMSLLSACVKL